MQELEESMKAKQIEILTSVLIDIDWTSQSFNYNPDKEEQSNWLAQALWDKGIRGVYRII